MEVVSDWASLIVDVVFVVIRVNVVESPLPLVVVIFADEVVMTPRKCDTGRGRDFGMDLLEQQSVINTTDDSMMNSIA